MFGNNVTIGDSIFISIFSMIVVFLVLLIISYSVDIIAFLILKSKKNEESGNGATQISGNIVTAPLQGRVQTILVKVGDNVKEGDTVAIIEAMKMENDVPSNFSGTVKQVLVSAGQNVDNGEGIIVL